MSNPYVNGHPFLSPAMNMLQAVWWMRRPDEVDITAMNDPGVRVIRRSWTPIKGWKSVERISPFPEEAE